MPDCTHRHATYFGKRLHFGERCQQTGVPEGSFTVRKCTQCPQRVDVDDLTGRRYAYRPEVLRPRDTPGPRPGSGISRREVYTPQHDGVEAMTDDRTPWGRALQVFS